MRVRTYREAAAAFCADAPDNWYWERGCMPIPRGRGKKKRKKSTIMKYIHYNQFFLGFLPRLACVTACPRIHSAAHLKGNDSLRGAPQRSAAVQAEPRVEGTATRHSRLRAQRPGRRTHIPFVRTLALYAGKPLPCRDVRHVTVETALYRGSNKAVGFNARRATFCFSREG